MQQTQTLGPEWLAHRFDESANQIRFVEYDRSSRSAVPFLTDQYLEPKPFRAVPRDSARNLVDAASPAHFIFHSGFCCSTLLAACFDQPGLASVLSEPMILNDAVGWRRRGAPPAAVGQLVDDSLALLARPFGDPACIIKPSTVFNGLAAAALKLRPESRALFMSAPLPDFLTSIAKKGLDGRLWARELFMGMRKESLTAVLGQTDEEFLAQTDLQIAACAWLGQRALFQGLHEWAPDRMRMLRSDQFLADPEAQLRTVADFFGIPLADDHIAYAMNRTMQVNSKDKSSFGRSDRDADYRAAVDAHGDEIRKVTIWARALADAAGLTVEDD